MARFRIANYSVLLIAFACLIVVGCGEPKKAPDNADKQDINKMQKAVDDIQLGAPSDAPSVDGDVDSPTKDAAPEESAKDDAKADDAADDDAADDKAGEPGAADPSAQASISNDNSPSEDALATIEVGDVQYTAALAGASWGNLKGRFVYDGKAPTAKKFNVAKEPGCVKHNPVDETIVVGENGGLENVAVYLYLGRGKKVSAIHPDYEKPEEMNKKVELDNNACRFEPHLQVLRTTQTLLVKNSDQWSHNTKYESFRQSFNQIVPAGGSAEFHLTKAESLPGAVNCNIHPWMSGHLLVRDDPYMAASGKDGSFEIKNLPVGEHEFVFWQESVGFLKKVKFKGGATSTRGRAKINIKEGDNDLGDIKIAPSTLK